MRKIFLVSLVITLLVAGFLAASGFQWQTGLYAFQKMFISQQPQTDAVVNAATATLTLKAKSGQTAKMLSIVNSSGSEVASISPSGTVSGVGNDGIATDVSCTGCVGTADVADAAVTSAKQAVITYQAQTIADSGDGSAAAGTLTVTSGALEATAALTCSDTDGCTDAISETGAVNGEILHLVNVGTNAVTVADSAGVTETTGSVALGAKDTLTFVYAGTAWNEVSASNN